MVGCGDMSRRSSNVPNLYWTSGSLSRERLREFLPNDDLTDDQLDELRELLRLLAELALDLREQTPDQGRDR